MMLEIARFGRPSPISTPIGSGTRSTGSWDPTSFHEKYPGATSGGLRNNAYNQRDGGLAVRHRRGVLSLLPAARAQALRELLGLGTTSCARGRT